MSNLTSTLVLPNLSPLGDSGLIFFLLLWGPDFVLAETDFALSQKELADLASPAVVKIIQYVKGEAEIPAFEINLSDFSVKKKEGVPETKVPVEDYLYGSGVIVSPDGYILTNSHVVSNQTVKNLLVADFVFPAITESLEKLEEDQLNKIKDDESKLEDFAREITDYVLKESKFNLDKKIVVVDPSSDKKNVADLFKEGFPARMVSVHDDFFKDDQDAALIKIEKDNLPSLKIGEPEKVSVGSRIYIFGFPSTADINSNNATQATFTEGIVNALKDSINKDFKIFQTDAKISKGSSGGPLLDEKGNVIGLVTYITNPVFQEDGDNFAFAIPIGIVQKAVKENLLSPNENFRFEEGEYGKLFRQGIALLRKNHCKEALSSFSLAKKSSVFPVEKHVIPYENECQEIIKTGKSVDSVWGTFWERIKEIEYLKWIYAGVGIIFSLVGFFVVLSLQRRMKKEEKEVDNIEEYLHLSLEDGRPYSGDQKDGLPEALKPQVNKQANENNEDKNNEKERAEN